MTMRFPPRHQYDEEADLAAGEKAMTFNDEPSLTQQQFAKDADINEITRRFGVTDGAIPPAVLDPIHFGNFDDAVDFRTALDRTREATDRFNLLPASIRNRFGNSPVALWEFVNNPDNTDESVKLGLLKRLEPKGAEPPEPPVTPTSGVT